jgi:hypothetical protein
MSAPDTAPFNDLGVTAEGPTRRNAKLLVALLAGFAAVVVVALLLLRGGDDPVEVTQAADAEVVQTQVEEPGDPQADDLPEGAEPLPVTTYEVFLERDPFDPVVPEDEPTPVTDAGGNADADADDADGASPGGDGDRNDTDPSDPDAPAPRDSDGSRSGEPGTSSPDDGPPESGAPPGECRGGNEEAVCDGRVVSLVDVTTDDQGRPMAVVQVDTTLYEVRSGDRFAQHFEVRAIDGECVNLLHGDDGFQLCNGDRVLK